MNCQITMKVELLWGERVIETQSSNTIPFEIHDKWNEMLQFTTRLGKIPHDSFLKMSLVVSHVDPLTGLMNYFTTLLFKVPLFDHHALYRGTKMISILNETSNRSPTNLVLELEFPTFENQIGFTPLHTSLDESRDQYEEFEFLCRQQYGNISLDSISIKGETKVLSDEEMWAVWSNRDQLVNDPKAF